MSPHRRLTIERLEPLTMYSATPAELTSLAHEVTDQYDDIAIVQGEIDTLMTQIGQKQDEENGLLQTDADLHNQELEAQSQQQTIQGMLDGFRQQINDCIVQEGNLRTTIAHRQGDIAVKRSERQALQVTWDEANMELTTRLSALRDAINHISSSLAAIGRTVTPQIEKLVPDPYPKEIGKAVDTAYVLRTLTNGEIAQWNGALSPSHAFNDLLTKALLTWQQADVQKNRQTAAENIDAVITHMESIQESDIHAINELETIIVGLQQSITTQQNTWNALEETINELVHARTEIPSHISSIDALMATLQDDYNAKNTQRDREKDEAVVAENNLLMALEDRVTECQPPDVRSATTDIHALTEEGDSLLGRTKTMQAVIGDIHTAEDVIWSDEGKSRLAAIKQTMGDYSFALTLDTQDWQEQLNRTLNAAESALDEDIDPSSITPLSIGFIYANDPTELERHLKNSAHLTTPESLRESVDETTLVHAVQEELSMAESLAAWTLADGYPVKKQPPLKEFNFSAFENVPIPQEQNFGGGPRISIPEIGSVEAYSNELALTFDAGALIVTRSAMQGNTNSDVFGYALREGDPQRMRVTITSRSTTPVTLHFGIIDQQKTDDVMDVQPGTHTYELPRKASYVQVHASDGRTVRMEHVELVKDTPKDAGRNRPLELALHATRVSDVLTALQYLHTHVMQQREQGVLSKSLAHLPKELGKRIALLVQEGADLQTLQTTFKDLPWGSLSPASMASLFPKEGMRNDLALSVMDFSGSAVTVAFRDPGFPTIVEIDHGAGMMGRRTAEHSDVGGGMCMVQVSMNNATPSGTYQIRILDPQTADKVIGTMNIVWNSATKTMSLGDDASMFIPGTYRRDDGVTPFGELIVQTLDDEVAVMTAGDECTINMRIAASIPEAFKTILSFDGYTNANIMAAERDTLAMTMASVCPALHCVTQQEFEQAFYDHLPQWRWENEMQTRALYRWDHIAFTQSRSSEWDRLSHNVGNYNEGLRDMIAQAFNAAAMLRQGRVQEADALIRTMQQKYDNHLSLPELHISAPYFMAFVEACCNVLDKKPIDVMEACNGAEAETARLQYQAFVSPSSAGDGTEVVRDSGGNPVTDASGHLVYQQTIDYAALTTHGIDAGQARNLVHIANKNLEHAIAAGAPPDVIASMQNQQTLAMANYNTVLGGGTVLTFQQENQQNILTAIAEGAPMTRLNAIAYLQENGLPIPTSAYDDFFASKEGLDYALTHMTDLDDLTNTLVAMGWLKGKGTLVATNLDDLREQLVTAGIGGAPTEASYALTSEQKEHSLDDFLNLYENKYSGADIFMIDQMHWISSHSLAGKAFITLRGELATRTGEDLERLCAKAEIIFGIPASSLAWAASSNIESVSTRLITLFTRSGYESLFTSAPSAPSSNTSEARILSFKDLGNGTYRMFFDATLDHPYGVASVYVLDASGTQINTTAVIVNAKGEPTRSIRGTLFADIPSSSLRDYIISETLQDGIGAGIANGVYSAHLDLQLAVWKDNDVSQHGLPGNIRTGVKIFSVPAVNPEVVTVRDLSTNPNPERRALENEILSRLNFPFNGTVAINLEISSFHKADELYALDLSGGTATGVLAPTTSKVEQVDLFAGQLVLKHQLPTGELYFTTFYHLTHILENITGNTYEGLQESLDKMSIPEEYKKTISDNINSRHDIESDKLSTLNLPSEIKSQIQNIIDSISAVQRHITDTLIPQWENEGKIFTKDDGLLGLEGKEGYADGDHFHVQFNIGSMKGEAIDVFHWINEQQNGLVTKADLENRSSYDLFIWDQAIEAMVNENEGIVLERADIKNNEGKVIAGENWAYALESGKSIGEMERVIWSKEENAFINADDHLKIWNPTTRSFQ